MKQKITEAKRWLRQAEHDLLVGKENFKNKFYSDVCYSAEQVAQKVLKAYIYFQGGRFVWEHSVRELAKRVASYSPNLAEFIEKGKILDQYYIPTRYPDALAPPAVPFESYSQKEAKEAIQIAEEIFNKVSKALNF